MSHRDQLLDTLRDQRLAPAPDAIDVLAEIRAWFANEVAVGDTALQMWVDKIDTVLIP